MADDRRYKGGDNYFLDDNTGFKVRASRAMIQWDNVATTKGPFSPRQPQDLVTGVPDEQAAWLLRPRQVNQFTVVATFVTAGAQPGALTLTVASTQGFVAGDLCQVMLDSGDPFTFTLGSLTATTLSWASPPLPSGVGLAFGAPLENQVVDLTRS